MGAAEPRQERPRKAGDHLGMPRRDVAEFARIGVEIEQPDGSSRRWIGGLITVRARPLAAAVDVFPAIRSNTGLFVFEIFAEDRSAGAARPASGQIFAKALPMG